MVIQADWPKIFLDCKNNVIAHVQPLHETSKESQPYLGIGAGGDRTKLADLTAEKAVVETLLENDISFTLISEESGIQKFGDKSEACYVTVDPIDGTTNFVRLLPFFCTSIAVSDKPVSSRVFAACVTDLFRNTTYTAFKGKGAFRDREKIKPSTTKSLDADEAVVGLDLNTYKLKSVAPQLSSLIQETRHIRHFGANALELCYVADGLTDAFIDLRGRLRATDVAAGFFIIREAGGILTSPEGQTIDLKLDPKETVKFVASGNREIHRRILDLVTPQGS